MTATAAISILDSVRNTNGMFFDHYSPRYNNITPTTTNVVPNIISSFNHIPDGASSTLLFTENFTPNSKDIANGFLYRVYYPPISAITSTNSPYPLPPKTVTSATDIQKAVYDFERTVVFVWDPQVGDQAQNPPPAPPERIDGDKNRKLASTSASPNYPPNQETTSYDYVRPSSAHTGGVNVVMCGGASAFSYATTSTTGLRAVDDARPQAFPSSRGARRDLLDSV